MYNPNEHGTFAGVYNWGGVNAEEPYYEGHPYGSTPGAALTANFGPTFDAARSHLGAPWRMPTREDFQELFDNCDFIDANGTVVTGTDKRITMNGVVGIRLRSRINGNVIFFPASGGGIETSWANHGVNGFYWSSSWVSDRNARFMYFSQNGTNPQDSYYRYSGYAVRPVF